MPDIFTKPGDIDWKRERELSVFPARQLALPPKEDVVDSTPIYQDLAALVDRSKVVRDDLAEVGEAFSIQIGEDDADVRAAHTQLGGDGISIKFQEYMDAIDEHQERRGDYLNEEFNGLSTGDMAKIKKKRYDRAVSKSTDEQSDISGIFDQLAKYGSNAVLLYLLGEQIAMHTSPKTQQAVAGKYPPGTETGAILGQIIQAMVMIKMLTGMTDDAIDEYQNMEIFPEGIDFDGIMERFKKAPAPSSSAFGFYRAQSASANHELLLNYSVGYCTQHIGQGFESWLGYLTARTTHEDALRSYHSGNAYRTGAQTLGVAHSEALTTKSKNGQAILDMVSLGLGRGMDWGETCCLLRFLDMFTPNILEIMRTVIQMSVAQLNWQAQQSFQWFLDLANHPWAVISEELIRELDKFFEKIVGELLDTMEMDNAVYDVLKACTPVDELFNFMLSAIVDMKSWYHNLINNLGISIDKTFRGMMTGWEVTFKVRRAQELLMAIDELLEKADLIGQLSEDDNLLTGIVSKLEGAMWKHDVNGKEAMSATSRGLDTAIDWCRKIGDWDFISSQLSKQGTPS